MGPEKRGVLSGVLAHGERHREYFYHMSFVMAHRCGKERNFMGEHFWARGYPVSTLGFELEQVRQYIREQEEADGTGGRF